MASLSTVLYLQKAKRASYKLVISAKHYTDVTADVIVNDYGAENFYVRMVDEDGNVLQSKAYTKEEMIKMSGSEEQILSDCMRHERNHFLQS